MNSNMQLNMKESSKKLARPYLNTRFQICLNKVGPTGSGILSYTYYITQSICLLVQVPPLLCSHSLLLSFFHSGGVDTASASIPWRSSFPISSSLQTVGNMALLQLSSLSPTLGQQRAWHCGTRPRLHSHLS